MLALMCKAFGKPSWKVFRMPLPLIGALAQLAGRGVAWRKLSGSLRADGSEFMNVTGWQAPVTLEEGLRAAALHFSAEQRR
jgi:UDP-glucose 4-epimerase